MLPNSASSGEFPEGFTERVNAASPSAIDELDRRFRDRLRGLVRQEMGRRFCRREDSEDVVQESLGAFYGALTSRSVQVDNSGGLWPLLRQFTHHKVMQHVEFHLRPPRNLGREQDVELGYIASVEPTPSDAVAVVDLIEVAVRQLLLLPDLKSHAVEILRGKLRGESSRQLAEQIGCSVSQVNRILAWVIPRFEQILEDLSSAPKEFPCPNRE